MNIFTPIYDILMEAGRRRGWQGEDVKLFVRGYISAIEEAVAENKCTYEEAIEVCKRENQP